MIPRFKSVSIVGVGSIYEVTKLEDVVKSSSTTYKSQEDIAYRVEELVDSSLTLTF